MSSGYEHLRGHLILYPSNEFLTTGITIAATYVHKGEKKKLLFKLRQQWSFPLRFGIEIYFEVAIEFFNYLDFMENKEKKMGKSRVNKEVWENLMATSEIQKDFKCT